MEIIKTTNLKKMYTTEEVETTALDNVNFQVNKGGVRRDYGSLRVREINTAKPSGHAR